MNWADSHRPRLTGDNGGYSLVLTKSFNTEQRTLRQVRELTPCGKQWRIYQDSNRDIERHVDGYAEIGRNSRIGDEPPRGSSVFSKRTTQNTTTIHHT